jgi:hypothetical protein
MLEYIRKIRTLPVIFRPGARFSGWPEEMKAAEAKTARR